MNYYITNNLSGAISLKDIPEVEYAWLYDDLKERLKQESIHVAHYFATPDGNRLRFYIIILDDSNQTVMAALDECVAYNMENCGPNTYSTNTQSDGSYTHILDCRV